MNLYRKTGLISFSSSGNKFPLDVAKGVVGSLLQQMARDSEIIGDDMADHIEVQIIVREHIPPEYDD